jgi:hypothetical protein
MLPRVSATFEREGFSFGNDIIPQNWSFYGFPILLKEFVSHIDNPSSFSLTDILLKEFR